MAQMPEAIILRKTEETKTGVTYCMADVKTNADRIRSMSDEELAGFLFEYGGSSPNCKDEIVSNCKSCRDCWIDWLKQEAE